MTDLSKWFNEIADGHPAADDMLAKINKLKQQVKYRVRRQEEINRERDELLLRIAGILGISEDDYPAFFENINNQ